MLAAITRWIMGLIGIGLVATGIALGAYFATQTDDDRGVAEDIEETLTQTPEAAVDLTSTAAVPEPSPHAIPTVGPPGPDRPPVTAAPTPEFGVCPPPVRTTPEDFPPEAPPPVRPPSELPGVMVEGGGPFKVQDVTLHLPAGRDFVILGGPPFPAEGELMISIYDIETASQLVTRGDGCEISRFVRDPAADAVFDQIVATLEVEG